MPATISDGVLEREARRGRRQAGERVEQRDHDRHVGAADRQHDEQAEQRRADQDRRDVEARRLAGGDRGGRRDGADRTAAG